ncbi:MarR family winged helix-turn-helix transcriptional regulator [Paenibacillus sp. KN14-4R]|uniref:MarR family winged helix-turn-helix transcriptional regulator n=1 Tax=Paenibacillus sp. KN14-4R TaxID=3445773 RepID=UPI003F9F2E16
MNKHALFQKFVQFTASMHQVVNDMTKDVKPDGITAVQYSILEYIATSQPITLSQISECLHISMPNTSRELKKLSEKNLLEKLDAAEDRRKQYICLSTAGQTMMDKAFEQIEGNFLQRIKDASDQDLEEMDHALDVLYQKLD